MMGLSRQAAARFSFMMAVPIIAMASLLEITKLIEQDGPVQWNMIALGAVISGLAAYLCISVFLRLLARLSMLPFAIYRVVLAGVIFALIL
jgi:undecaprenyl-diphosphatase